MKNNLKRGMAALLVLVMLVSVFSGLSLTAFAATGTLVANTGTRHTVCTSLSTQAQAYYTGEYTYENVSALAGGSTSCLDSVDSAMITKLRTLMTDTMTKSVSYSSLTTYWPKTDANNGSSDAILFYSDEVSSSYNREHVWPKSRGSFYQSNAGSDLHHLRPTDTNVNSTRGNMTMGNVRSAISGYKTYQYNGNDVLYYSSSDDLVEVNDNIKGDVARILLYVYARWAEPNLFEDEPNPVIGSGDDANNGLKVIESLDTLLQWCEEDPVDEWEMGRNDQVENVQGNRNVFIDYPEYAWLIFGQTPPSDMTTPSGEAANSGSAYTITAVSGNTAWGTVSVSGKVITATPADGYYASGYEVTSGSATVTQSGNSFTVTATSDCTVKILFSAKTAVTVSFSVPSGVTQAAVSGYAGEAITLPTPTGTPSDTTYSYQFLGWYGSSLTTTTEKPTSYYAAGSEFTPTASTTLYALYSYVEGGTGGSGEWTLVTDASSLSAGAELLIASNAKGFVAGAISSSVMANITATFATDYSTVTKPDDAVVLTLGGSEGAWTLANSDGQLLGATAAKKLAWDSGTTTWTITIESNDATIQNGTSTYGRFLYNVSSPRFTTYTSATSTSMLLPQLYMKSASGTTYYTTDLTACEHAHTTTTTVDATCTAAGSVTVTCDDCGATLSTTTIEMLSHNWVAGTVVAPTCTA
ncbi:MAG: endonuclease, partial [Faecousia sp.]